MCYFPEKIYNKRFLPTRKNHFHPERCYDERMRYIEVECGHCFECRKKKRNQWRLRNFEELRKTKHAIFFTGTLSPKRYEYLCEHYGFKENEENLIITKELRLFLERIRKSCGHSIRHWCVTEKGHQNTRRIHLHGIFYLPKGMRYKKMLGLLYNNWIGGYCYYGKYVNNKTINYITKYMTKEDRDNPDYQAIILCTKGIGKEYVKRCGWRHKWQGAEKTADNYYDEKTGKYYPLPRYWREKVFEQWQRDELLLNRLDKKIERFNGYKWDVSTEKGITELQNYKKEFRTMKAALHGDDLEHINKLKEDNRHRRRVRYHLGIKQAKNGEPPKWYKDGLKRAEESYVLNDIQPENEEPLRNIFKEHGENILRCLQAETASGVGAKEAAGYWEWTGSDYQGDLFAYTSYPANWS